VVRHRARCRPRRHSDPRKRRPSPPEAVAVSYVRDMWIGKSIFPRTVQPLVAPIGPETHSVQSTFRLGPKGVPFLTGQKGGEASRMRRNAAPPGTRSRAFACDERLAPVPASPPQPQASPPAWPRIIGPRLFLLSCRIGGETGWSTMFSLTASIGQPMGESQYPRAARPLLFSPMKGRDARASVSPNLWE